MTYSEIKITFNQKMPLEGRVIFTIDGGGTFGIIMFERWVLFRSGSNQVSKGIFTGTLGERAAINFLESFNLDYNSTGIYVTERTETEVTIKATNPNITFANGSAILPGELGEPSELLNVDFEYNNFNGTIFHITDVEFEEATNPCTHIKVKVTTSELATEITSPITVNPNNANPFYFESLRSIGTQISCKNADGQEATQYVNLPAVLSSGNINLTINNSPSGATVIANLSVSFGLNLEYSLDDTTWQASNVFDGLGGNDYTLYVKDQYGCKVTKNFVVDDFGIQSPYFLISNSNSLRFANRITWGDCANYKTLENTLSCEADVKTPYKEIQQFQSCDIITTQFKSNYDDIIASVIKENGDEVSLNIEQKTNNMRLKDKRDARKYNLGGGKTGVYFISGNIYDYDTGVDTGEDYTLNGTLPTWGIVGNYIKLASSWFLIEDVVYDENRNAEVLVIENTFIGSDTIVQVSCLYNLFNYEVYEFTIDMFDYLNQNIQVRINNNDSSFGNLVHLSEVVNVKIKQEDTIEIRYKNDTNTDIFYATGIEHKLRLPLFRKDAKPKFKLETNETDTDTNTLEAEKRQGKEFKFEPVTEGIMEKLTEALIHRFVYLDGVRYVCTSDPQVEGALGKTNLYVVKANMTKGSGVYNSQTGDGGNLFASGSSEIPGLIDSGNGYVIY